MTEDDIDGGPTVRVVTTPTLDLDSYFSLYSGSERIRRLIFIAERCPPLRVDALRLAVADLRNTANTRQYQWCANQLMAITDDSNDAPDMAWVGKTDKQAHAQLEKLEHELKGHRSNLIKESIRMGHTDLGDFHHNRGDLEEAMKSYIRTRDYCATAKHHVAMCLRVIKVGIELNAWNPVNLHISKALSTTEAMENVIVMSMLHCSNGLVQLHSKSYKAAAHAFLQAVLIDDSVPSMPQSNSATASMSSSSVSVQHMDIMSNADVAVYGALCAMATFTRPELNKQVLENANFKQFLELVPNVRELLHDFNQSRYMSCLKRLDSMHEDLFLDLHLAAHVSTLYAEIRKRALVQFFSPFLSVELSSMAVAFNTDVITLEREVTSLISEGKLAARIDSQAQVLHARQTDARKTAFLKAIEMGDAYQRDTKALLLRVAMQRANICVVPPYGSTEMLLSSNAISEYGDQDDLLSYRSHR